MDYDVITVGGGLGAAALAKALAEKGVRVLVLEREKAFKDRVRGEEMHSWGVAETRALGIYDLLKETCGHEVRLISSQFAGAPPAQPRDLIETSPHQAGTLNFYHPEMQTVLLQAAEQAGAHVRRGVLVTGVTPGQPAGVRFQENGSEHSYTARLVVGADGRNSSCRTWAGLNANRDPEHVVLAGLLHEGLNAPEDQLNLFINPQSSTFALVVPIGRQRFRSYVGYHKQVEQTRLSGREAADDFVAVGVGAGAPAEWYEGATLAGPLAAFDVADIWVDHPYRDGIVLIGDAAAASDPSFGCGLSLTLRDVRVLRDQLLANDDWDAAAHAYAAEHDQYFAPLHRHLTWMRFLFHDPSPEAGAQRQKAFPRIGEDPTRIPDIVGVGPEFPSDDAARDRFFGED